MNALIRDEPFPHATSPGLFSDELCNGLLDWLERDAPWQLRVESFYEQWEVHLDDDALPAKLDAVVAPDTGRRLAAAMLDPLGGGPLRLKEVTAHRLLKDQTIRIHNDYVEDRETHRLLLQLNRGWNDEQGGLLMLFSGPSAEQVARVVRPVHGSMFGFAIGPQSFHAVSTIRSGERYTVVYSYERA